MTTPFLSALLIAGCATTLPPYDYSKEPDPRKGEYVIGIGDGLRITVWKNPELGADGHVRPDGTITMPLIGDLQAVSRTPSQLKADITRRLAAYVRDEGATVTVAVVEVISYRFTVSGNVAHPGMFTSKFYVTVADAVALAGGPTRFASPEKTVIIRTDKAGTRRIPVNLTEIDSGEHPQQNLVIISGDTVLVP